MNILIRWYNQNRKMLWIAIIVIIGVFGLIQALNSYYKNNTKEESSSAGNSTTTYNAPNYSVVSQKEISTTVSENSQAIIKSFFDYCSNNNVQGAYSLLSKECKDELYPNINEFKRKYLDIIFTNKKTYNSKLWISNDNKNTYRIEIYGDLLSTGGKEEMPIEDFYTIIYEDGKYSLSIKGYIGKQNINISKEQEGITVTVLSKQVYMEYEKYKVEVKNNSKKDIMLNTKESTSSMYIEDKNNVKHIAFLNELSNQDLRILSGFTNEINIRFNRTYKPNISIEKIVFDNIKIGQDSKTKKIEIDI